MGVVVGAAVGGTVAAAVALAAVVVGPARCCPPRHTTHYETSFIVINGILCYAVGRGGKCSFGFS
jgi:hypothetical protein